MHVKVKPLHKHIKIPAYQTEGAAGMDLSANESGIIPPGGRNLVRTGLFMSIPKGFEGQVRPRSGLALHFGVTVLNTPGTIDSDYRGEVCVLLINHGCADFQYNIGDRIAQIVFNKVEQLAVDVIEEDLWATSRGEKGFGSTGV